MSGVAAPPREEDRAAPSLSLAGAELKAARKLRSCRNLADAVSIMIASLSETGSNLQRSLNVLRGEDFSGYTNTQINNPVF